MKTIMVKTTVWMALISVFMAFQGFFLTSSVSAQAPNQLPVRRALLIGIGKYQAVSWLPGAKNDIELVSQVLTTRYEFSKEHMWILQDEAATRDVILETLRKFVQEVGPNDVVYIHYSGHGSQVEDLSGDENEDQLDETILPYDARTEGVPDITDDELHEILASLQSHNAVFVLDSCHSGTATRGLQVRVRSVPRDMRVEIYKKKVRSRGIQPVPDVQPNSDRYILLTGAAAHQEALDGPVDGENNFHGIFTYALFKNLQLLPETTSARDVFAGVKKELMRLQNQLGRTSMPEPQLEAPQDRLGDPLFLFAGLDAANKVAGTPRAKQSMRSWVEAQITGDNSVLLVKGVSLGALPGSIWGLYSNQQLETNLQKSKALVTVVETLETDAVARIETQGEEITEATRAVLIVPAPPPETIPVFFRDVSSEKRHWLESAIRDRLHNVEIVEAGQFARFVVDTKGETFHVYGADGTMEILSFPFSSNGTAIHHLVQILMQSHNAIHLLSLENPNLGIQLNVRAVQTRSRGVAVQADVMEAPTYRIRRSGEPRTFENSLQLEIQTDSDAYITVIDVDAEGNVNQLFPNSYQKKDYYSDGFLSPGKSIYVPDSLQYGNRAGFHWDIAEPPGIDTIKVFATPNRHQAERIRQAIQLLDKGGAKATPTSEKSLIQLGNLRRELFSITQGTISVSDRLPDWTAASVSVVVRR